MIFPYWGKKKLYGQFFDENFIFFIMLKMSLQESFSEFDTRFKANRIETQNKYLQELFKKLSFLFVSDIKNEDDILQIQNESKIIIIDEYQETNNKKYFFVCLDYKLIIFDQNQNFDQFLSQQQNSNKYYLKQNPMSETEKNDNDLFLYEINNFCEKFKIQNHKLQRFWQLIVECISGFLIKKSYQNHKNKDDEKSKKKFLEEQEKIESIDSFITLRELGRGSLASVDLVYHIKTEELFAMKTPYDSFELIERERENYLKIEYPFIVKYFGYVENNKRKCLLIEYVEGRTLDEYEINELTEEEKHNIIFELLLTVQHIHSLGYICRDLHFKNIMINENKELILIDFDRVNKIEETKTLDFFQLPLPELENGGKLDYKSDVCLVGCVIFFIMTGNKLESKSQMSNNEEFMLKKKNEIH